MAFGRMFDWKEGDEKPAAMVFLATKIRLRLTDENRQTIPDARCRRKNDPTTVFTCDEDGVVELPLPDDSQTTIDLEWEPPEACDDDGKGRFYLTGTFQLHVSSKDDPECETRLEHLGFLGSTLAEQVSAYQGYLGREPTGDIHHIRDEMVGWHDGGNHPEWGAGVAQPAAAQLTEDSPNKFRLRLHDMDARPMLGASYRVTVDGSVIAEDTASDGWVEISFEGVCPERVQIEWGKSPDPSEAFQFDQEVVLGFGAAVDELAKAMVKLHNLGYPSNSPEEFERAVCAFQADYNISQEVGLVDGALPKTTQQKLSSIYQSCDAVRGA